MKRDADAVGSFLFGVAVGAAGLLGLANAPWSLLSKARDAVTVCEAALPRNQSCRVTAVPDTEEADRE